MGIRSKAISDRWLILKDAVRSKFKSIRVFKQYSEVKKIVRLFEIEGIRKVVKGWPDTFIIVTKDKVIRVPLDKLSLKRCRINRVILEKLQQTCIASVVPEFLEERKVKENICFCETKLPGLAVGTIPLFKMEHMVRKAIGVLTVFNRETAEDITVDSRNFQRLIGNDFRRLVSYLGENNKEKLNQIEQRVKQQLLGKEIKTTWFHGDYKADNVLFNIKTWEIEGIIDWDLSKRKGLPLLDVFFLLIYKDSMLTGKSISYILKNRFFDGQFNSFERDIIDKYLNDFRLTDDIVEPLTVVFWLNHVVSRCRQVFVTDLPNKEEWLRENVYEVIEKIRQIK